MPEELIDRLCTFYGENFPLSIISIIFISERDFSFRDLYDLDIGNGRTERILSKVADRISSSNEGLSDVGDHSFCRRLLINIFQLGGLFRFSV